MVAQYAQQASSPGPIVDAEFRDMVRTEAAQIGPKKPDWYDMDARPNVDDVRAEAQNQKQYHQLRLLQSTFMELRIGMEISAIFERDEDWAEMGEAERFVVPLLRSEHNMLMAFTESMSLQLTSRARSGVDREETAAKESYLYEWWDDASTSHSTNQGGELMRALAYDMEVHAMAALYLAPDPGNDRSGVRMRRVDPKFVYPVYEGDRGLARVYCIYDADSSTVLGNFGDGPGGKVTRKIKKIAKDRSSGTGQFNDLNNQHELVYFSDRRSTVVTWADEVIVNWEHKYWRVPWRIMQCCWRQPSGTALTTGILGANGLPEGMRDADGRPLGGSSIQRDIARVYEPFLASRVPLNDELEMIGSRLFTGIRDAKNPPIVERKDLADARRGELEVRNWGGGVTTVIGTGEITAYPTIPVAENMTPMLEMMKTMLQAGIPAPVLQGQTLGAQSSGTAIDILNELGFTPWVPFFKQLQRFVALAGHDALGIVRDYNEALPGVSGIGTGFGVPRRTPGDYGSYTPYALTRKMLEDSKCYTEAKLSRWSMAGSVAATSAAMSINNLGIGDDRFFITELGIPGEVEDLIARRRRQNMENSPDYANAVMINQLYEELEMATARKDEITLRKLVPLFKRIVAIQTIKDEQLGMMVGAMKQNQMQQQAEQDMAQQQQNAQMASGTGFNPTVAASPQAIGNTVGTEGGAPMQPQGGVG